MHFKNSLDKLAGFFEKKTVMKLIAVQFIVLLACIIFLKVIGVNNSFFLLDDGYYNCSRMLFNGEIGLSGNAVGVGIPFVLQFLHFFPETYHPFIRIFFSFFINAGVIFVVFGIFKRILTSKQLAIGLIATILNPLYLWWGILRLAPELYITFFLGVLILFYIKYLESDSKKYIYYLFIILPVSIFFKPVLFFVPLFLLLLFFKKNRFLTYASLALFLLGSLSFYSYMKFSEPREQKVRGLTYRGFENILFVYQLETALETGRFAAEREEFETDTSSNSRISTIRTDQWLNKYFDEHPKVNMIELNWQFIKEHPGIFLLSKAVSPLFFISFSDSVSKTLFNLFYNGTWVLLAFAGLKRITKDKKFTARVVIFALLGYYFIYFLNAPFARYSMSFIFYFLPFAGAYLLPLDYLKKKTPA